ncbi:organic cation transporter protein-like isoform X1 [Melanaphis sacchari]|uniref:organic cation transporter protein-like isoform X1 n=1 Tax=Melanaphis sacchari TaxID=742174 RepID=UPI000DC15964|nr:organic cation transporter protein-like isoform X1 [Melanaphis sacchari]XP_025194419.1 organic cation transporter protein-like isoform X1 [Melanaphis sacchari]XP_025194420.1 organic cation transporter protein-like isoform X1 [Melanaphis sacchari]XP_025194421.1 organic cation transporter protein-like isoform X1 [Melanaphis sacchari]XP_025194422.1 organic cation transporter protein-like isoform X1 [Melanaphis sacchari]XP_025194423.1 organic cation transporter protein-like isoform X1 [Melanaph
MANNVDKWSEEQEPNSFLLGEDRNVQPGIVRQNRRQSGNVGVFKDDKRTEKTHEDPVSMAIGEFGRWQAVLTLILSLLNLPCTWHIFVLTFQGAETDFWCTPPSGVLNRISVDQWKNLSSVISESLTTNVSVYDPCHYRDINYGSLPSNYTFKELLQIKPEQYEMKACSSWQFNTTEFGDTITSEWNLVCDRKELKNFAEMMFLMGVAFGGFFSGLVSDRFGRKKTLMASLIMQLALGILVAICPWFEFYLVLRFILGFVCVSIVFSGFVLCMELVGGKWLTIAGVLYLLPVPMSYIIISGIAYICRGWRLLQWCVTLPAVFFLVLHWFVPESPRWLLAMGKVEETMEVLQKASKINKHPLPANMDKILKQSINKFEINGKPKVRVSDLFRSKNIRKISLVLYILWFSLYLVYYGLVLNLSNIGGNIYVNTIVSGLVEIPSILISVVILLKMGRRIPLCLTMVAGGIACLLTTILPPDTDELISLSLVMAGKFSVSSSNVIMPLYTAELFPTVIRNLGVGTSNIPAGIALIMVPYLWNLSSFGKVLPLLVLGTVSVIGGLSVLMLPETGNYLSDTLEEVEDCISSSNNSQKKYIDTISSNVQSLPSEKE